MTAFRHIKSGRGGAKSLKPADPNYQRLLDDAEAAIELFTLAEQAEDDLVEALIPLDEYLIAQGMDRAIVEEYLIRAAQNLYHRIESANSIDTVLTELKNSGAVVIDAEHVYLPPDHGRLNNATSDTPRNYEVKTEPRLAWALAALKTLGIYGDDLIVRVGRVDKDMMREHPYIVLEIPRINKQIILCEQVGNRTFVAHEILDPQHFEKLKKSLLRGLSCVTDFVSGNDWGKTLLSHVTGDAEDFVAGAKVKNLAFKEAARKPKPIKLTQDIIVQAAKEWAAGHDGKFPVQKSGLIETGVLAGRTWSAVCAALRGGRVEGLPIGTCKGLADFLEMKGLKVAKNSKTKKLTQDMIVKAAKEWAAAHDGKFPVQQSGHITEGVLAGRTWQAVNNALYRGYVEGLPKGMYKGLADLLELKGLKISLRSETKKLTQEIIIQAAKEWAATHDGKFPVQQSGLIKHGILAGRKWSAISDALRGGRVEGFPKGTCKGLADFFELKGLQISFRSDTKKLTQDRITQGLLEWADSHEGVLPRNRELETIQDGILVGRTWIAISTALRGGYVEGLSKGSCKGLRDFKTQFVVAGKYEAYKAVKAFVGFVQNLWASSSPPPAP